MSETTPSKTTRPVRCATARCAEALHAWTWSYYDGWRAQWGRRCTVCGAWERAPSRNKLPCGRDRGR